MRRLITLTMLLALMGVTALPSAAAVRDPDGGQVPFYARINPGGFAVSDGDTTMVYFYRPPACIPEDFNLLEFFDFPTGPSDPGAFGCQPPTTEGHAIWETDIFVDPAPFFSKLKGLGSVPVWFVDTSDYQNAISDGELTIGELDGLNPQKGTASHLNEVLRPSEVENIPMLIVRLAGELEDGTPFRAHHVGIREVTITSQIVIG